MPMRGYAASSPPAACRQDDPNEVRGAAIEVAALVACNTGQVFATFAGAVSETRYSGMMTSLRPDTHGGAVESR